MKFFFYVLLAFSVLMFVQGIFFWADRHYGSGMLLVFFGTFNIAQCIDFLSKNKD